MKPKQNKSNKRTTSTSATTENRRKSNERTAANDAAIAECIGQEQHQRSKYKRSKKCSIEKEYSNKDQDVLSEYQKLETNNSKHKRRKSEQKQSHSNQRESPIIPGNENDNENQGETKCMKYQQQEQSIKGNENDLYVDIPLSLAHTNNTSNNSKFNATNQKNQSLIKKNNNNEYPNTTNTTTTDDIFTDVEFTNANPKEHGRMILHQSSQQLQNKSQLSSVDNNDDNSNIFFEKEMKRKNTSTSNLEKDDDEDTFDSFTQDKTLLQNENKVVKIVTEVNTHENQVRNQTIGGSKGLEHLDRTNVHNHCDSNISNQKKVTNLNNDLKKAIKQNSNNNTDEQPQQRNEQKKGFLFTKCKKSSSHKSSQGIKLLFSDDESNILDQIIEKECIIPQNEDNNNKRFQNKHTLLPYFSSSDDDSDDFNYYSKKNKNTIIEFDYDLPQSPDYNKTKVKKSPLIEKCTTTSSNVGSKNVDNNGNIGQNDFDDSNLNYDSKKKSTTGFDYDLSQFTDYNKTILSSPDENKPYNNSKMRLQPNSSIDLNAISNKSLPCKLEINKETFSSVHKKEDAFVFADKSANSVSNNTHGFKGYGGKMFTSNQAMFATAGTGKRVTVSKESLNRAQKLLNNEGNEEANKNTRAISQNPMFSLDKSSEITAHHIMFKTAGTGKRVTASENSLNQADRILNGNGGRKLNNNIESTFQKPMFSKDGSGIKVSEESVNRATKMLNKNSLRFSTTTGSNTMVNFSEVNVNNRQDFKTDNKTNSTSQHIMFTTAGTGKIVTASEDNMNQADRILNSNGDRKTNINIESTFQSPMFSKAGSGHVIKVSEDRVNRADKMLNDSCSLKSGNMKKNDVNNRQDFKKYNGKPVNQHIMFKTAGTGKRVTASEHSLHRSQKLLTNKGNEEANKDSKPSSHNPKMSLAKSSEQIRFEEESEVNNRQESKIKSTANHIMFKTAGTGKRATASENSLNQADRILNGNSDRNLNNNIESTFQRPMFSKAGSGITIKVSEESVNRATKMLNKNSLRSGDRKKSSLCALSTSTGSNTMVNFSEVNVNNRQDFKTDNKTNSTSQHIMFTTAGTGKIVTASEDNMNQADRILNSNGDRKTNINIESTFQSPMFSKAGSGHVIKVSEDRVNRADKMLNDKCSLKSGNMINSSFAINSTGAGSGSDKMINFSEENAAHRYYFNSNDKSETSADQHVMFKAAGTGKRVTASEHSLDRANRILHIDSDEKLRNNIKSSLSSPMFSKGSDRTKKMLNDKGMSPLSPIATATGSSRFITLDHNLVKIGRGSRNGQETNHANHVMFTTAGTGKRVIASKESLYQADRMLNTESDRNLNDNIKSSMPIPMFSRAGSSKAVNISAESLNRANKILSDQHSLRNEDKMKSNTHFSTGTSRKIREEANPKSQHVMFETAGSGKKVTASEDFLVRADRILNSERDRKLSKDIEYASQKPMFSSAGSGKTLKVSVESLNRANKMLHSQCSARKDDRSKSFSQYSMGTLTEPGKMVSISEQKTTSILHGAKPATQLVMFETAGSGKKISASEDSLDQANKVLNGGKGMEAKKKIESAFQKAIFSTTGSREAVKDASESLNKAYQKLSDQCSVNNGVRSKSKSQYSMKTATTKKMISVSKQNAANIRRLNEINDEKKSSSIMLESAGSGKIVTAARESLDQADRILNGERDRKMNANVKSTFHQNPMFSSAGSGKVVQVSAASLNLANKILNDKCSSGNNVKSKSSSCSISYAVGAGKSVEGVTPNNRSDCQSYDETKSTDQNVMFETAGSGKRVTACKESLNRADRMLNRESNGKMDVNFQSTFHQNSMLSSAGSGIVIKVSEESLNQGNKILNDQRSLKDDEDDRMFKIDYGTKRIPQQNVYKAFRHSKRAKVSQNKFHRTDKNLTDNEITKPSFQNTIIATTGFDKAMNISEKLPNQTDQILNNGRCFKEDLNLENNNSRFTNSTSAIDVSKQYGRFINLRRDDPITPTIPKSHGKTASPVNLKYNPYAKKRNVSHFLKGCNVKHSNASIAFNTVKEKVGPVSTTPLQTPKVANSALITRSSTRVRNPYTKQKRNSETPNANKNITPKLLSFHHVSATFSGKKIPSRSLTKASLVLSESNIQHESMVKRNVNNMRPQVLDYGEEDIHTNRDKISLSQLSNKEKLFNSSNDQSHIVSHIVKQVTSANSTKLRFDQHGIPISFSDMPRSESKVLGEIRDLHPSLLKLGCKTSLLSNRWIQNHFKWIVWKLACMERRFPASLANRYLTYPRVVSQLHKRYEQELRCAIRPALRKVLNKDASASQPMILCVNGIQTKLNKSKDDNTGGTSSSSSLSQAITILELTDGWYSVTALPDKLLVNKIHQGKVKIGTKLLISNASLQGADDGIDPLDKSYNSKHCSVVLKIFYNSTRLARWDAKLGFAYIRNDGGRFFIRSLSDIRAAGGSIPTVDLIICRQYPRLFLQKQNNNDDNSLENNSLILSEFQEHKAQHLFEKNRHKMMDDIMEVARNESNEEVESISPIIWRRMMKSVSPEEFYQSQSLEEQREINKWREKRLTIFQELTQKSINQTLKERNQLCRESIPFCRFLVRTRTSGSVYALLTAWQITDDHMNILQEGNVVRMRDVIVKDSIRDGMLQLSINRRSYLCLSPIALTKTQLVDSGFVERRYIPIFRTHLHFKGKRSRQHNTDVDTIGYVLKVVECNTDLFSLYRLYLTDESGFIIRLEIEFSEGSAHPWINNDIEGKLIALRDVQLYFFDEIENCAVATWTEKSDFVQKLNCRVTNRLKSWSVSKDGKMLCQRLYHYLVTGITPYSSSSRYENLVGYITKIFSNRTSLKHGHEPFENKTLLAEIDASGNITKKVSFPIFLLQNLYNAMVSNDHVRNENKLCCFDEVHNQIDKIERMFRNSGILLHFVLNSSHGQILEVERVKILNSKSLCQLYRTFTHHP